METTIELIDQEQAILVIQHDDGTIVKAQIRRCDFTAWQKIAEAFYEDKDATESFLWAINELA
jgi:hypothetical protein